MDSKERLALEAELTKIQERTFLFREREQEIYKELAKGKTCPLCKKPLKWLSMVHFECRNQYCQVVHVRDDTY